MSHELVANGVSVTVRPGWEVEFGELVARPGTPPRSLIHLANFALPPERGDYGSGAVELMDRGAILVIVMEFATAQAGRAMFSDGGLPTSLEAGDFSADALQRRIPGQAGAQRFFIADGRPFGLYVVLGSLRNAAMLAPEASRTLADIRIG